MTRPSPLSRATLMLALSLASLLACPAFAQKATAIPKLDLNKLTGTWYQIAKLPVKSEKKCLSDNTVLYALNDKANTLQIGTFCTMKGGDHDNMNATAKLDKAGDGKLKIRRLILLSRKYWVLATDPDFNWALVGTPNHKSLWILARQATLPADLYTRLQNTASGQGFPVAKLVLVTHPANRVTLASPSANPNQIETPAPTPTQTPAPAGKP
ncbi:MAG TPA: lipocalin family protein [Acidobacteriaceae bacterium]|nr:lipocalin family protein [Acidobacteriaceae bacterium]